MPRIPITPWLLLLTFLTVCIGLCALWRISPCTDAKDTEDSVIVEGGSGFFSNCCIKLGAIIDFYNEKARLPKHVDSSQVLGWYKPLQGRGPDVTFEYFQHYDEREPDAESKPPRPVHFDYGNTQFTIFKSLDFRALGYFTDIYFSPSAQIRVLKQQLMSRYSIDPETTWVLFHRGNDKALEVTVPPRPAYVERLLQQTEDSEHRKVILQSDETEFLEESSIKLREKGWEVVVFWEEIRHMQADGGSTVDQRDDMVRQYPPNLYSKYFLAIMLLMSSCHGVITGTGNCPLWVALFRGHARGLHQWKDGAWYD
jgi:hypothetical protein